MPKPSEDAGDEPGGSGAVFLVGPDAQHLVQRAERQPAAGQRTIDRRDAERQYAVRSRRLDPADALAKCCRGWCCESGGACTENAVDEMYVPILF